jgi:hypothetical protein
MGISIVALALGLVLGIAAGGRPRNAGRRPVRAVGVLAAGVVAQAVPELGWVEGDAGLALVLLSYGLVTTFALVNLRLVGMPVALVGLLLNVVVIGLNGGMPVRAEAIVAAGIADHDEVASLDFGGKRHLETPDDRLVVLGDIIPVPGFREVVSFGDLILAAGVADVVFRLLRPRRAPRQPAPVVLAPDPRAIDVVAPAA